MLIEMSNKLNIMKVLNKYCFILLIMYHIVEQNLSVDAVMTESRELMSGKVLRVVVLHVRKLE